MAQFSVKISKVKADASELEGIVKEMNSCLYDLQSVYNTLSIYNTTGLQIRSALRSVKTGLVQKKNQIHTMGNNLSSIMELYKKSETKITNEINGFQIAKFKGKSTGAQTAGSISTDSTGNTESKWKWTSKDTFDVLGKAGVFGSIAKTIYGAASRDYSTNDSALLNGTKLIKDLCSTVKSICSYVGSGNLQELVGLKAWEAEGFIKANWKSISDISEKSINPTASKLSNFFKDAGTLLTFAVEGIENLQENDNIGRGIAEMFGETAVNLALDYGVSTIIGTALTGILGAVGVTAAAPAVVVGAATVGVVWGLNEISKQITKKYMGEEMKLDELISDSVLDFPKNLKNVISSWSLAGGGGSW